MIVRKLLQSALIIAAGCGLAACVPAKHPEPDADLPALSTLLGGSANEGFAVADELRSFQFPADHGPHPEYRNEWWYVTGNLDGNNGRRFGYELTLFRFALTPPPAEREAGWRANEVYVGHFAVSDVENDRFLVAEQISRGAADLAGASRNPVQVWLYDWSLRHRPAAGTAGSWQLRAAAQDFAIELSLEALKSPVLQGEKGLSRKSLDGANASYYYSMPRLRTTGSLRIDDRQFEVNGLSWLDREWSTSALGARQVGWDWFALQLDNGNELMFYQLRRADGSADEASAGSLIMRDGTRLALAHDEVELQASGSWESPRGGRYPQGWQLRIPSQSIDLRISPVMADQELDTFVRYWEGAVDVTGTQGATRVSGRGYVELTGYATAGGAK
ncbi:MAG: lipocalin-like domain-containing protein [Woeseia sp.]